VRLSDKYPPAWANKNSLDEVARILKADPQVGVDLTFLIRNATTKYPSVIDGKPYDPKDLGRKARARAVASQIIARYGLNVPNPYCADRSPHTISPSSSRLKRTRVTAHGLRPKRSGL
jgi:hypothetical protein